ncbi:hypothetical protein B0H13DRAFT_1957094 [Mycena leptocephala]|nr:hypothetical protein B0H13DRAFT_1957094 [Mycena leptocephala]
MPTIPDAPVSMLAGSALPNTTTNAILAALIAPAMGAAFIHFASPLRLTGVLVAAIADAEKIYVEAQQTGLLSATETEALYTLQLKVSAIHEETLRNSLSWCTVLGDFLRGRTLSVLRCIREVKDFETRLKILKEAQLRERNFNPLESTVSLRRRGALSPRTCREYL